MEMSSVQIREFLDKKADLYNTPDFIEHDPVCIPHRYSRKEDIEISGFLTAAISWGNRKMIVRNARLMMDLMDNSPFEFVSGHSREDLDRLEGFVHRTFNSADLVFFVKALQQLYLFYGGLETVFTQNKTQDSLQPAIHILREKFFMLPHEARSEKHIADPVNGSAAKRINMFLRWMVRNDKRGVDFGIWKSVSPSILSCPLDLHSGNVARKLGLLTRKQNDARAVAELDLQLRKFDPADPVKYDFALFGLGIYENFQGIKRSFRFSGNGGLIG
jgi:uncharacterized protein (TIGR02757 family)